MAPKLKPAFLLNNVVVMAYVKHIGKFTPQEQLDTFFQSQAIQNGKKVDGLETAEFQFNLLFNGSSLQRQALLLMCNLYHIQTEEPKQTEEPGVSQPVAGTPAAKTKLPKKGTIIKKGGVKYVITTSSGKVKTVSVLGVANKTKKSITIAKTVSYKGYQYAVTGICKKAFYKMSKLKKIKVLSTKITKVGKQAFKKTNVKLKIQVPKKKLKKYRKLFQGKGLGKKANIV